MRKLFAALSRHPDISLFGNKIKTNVERENHFFMRYGEALDNDMLKAQVASAYRLAKFIFKDLLDKRRHLPLTQKGLYCVSQIYIANELGVVVKTVQRWYRLLEKAGFVVLVRQGNKRVGPSVYKVVFEKFAECARPSLFSQLAQNVSQYTSGNSTPPSTSLEYLADNSKQRKEGRRRNLRRKGRTTEPKPRKRYPKKDPSEWKWRRRMNSQPLAHDAHLKEPAPPRVEKPADLSDDLFEVQEGVKDLVDRHDLTDPRNADARRFIESLLRLKAKPTGIIARIRKQDKQMFDPMFCYTPAVKGELEIYKADLQTRARNKRDRDARMAEAPTEKADPSEAAAVFARYRKVSEEPVPVKTETRAVGQDVIDLVNAERERRAKGGCAQG